MITKENYFTSVAPIDFSEAPEKLRKGHDYVREVTKYNATWKFYDIHKEIKETIDKHFANVENYLNQKKAHPAKSSNPSSTPVKKQKSATSHKKVANKDSHLVERISDEVQLIAKYCNMHEKEKKLSQIKSLIAQVQKAIYEKRSSKTTPYGKEIMHIQNTLIHVYNLMARKGYSTVQKINIDSKWLNRLTGIAKSELALLSIALLKRYANLAGRPADKQVAKKKAHNLKEAMTRAANVSKKISADDKYFEPLKTAYNSLQNFLTGKTPYPVIHEAQLTGIMSFIGGKASNPINSDKNDSLSGLYEDKNLFTPINELASVGTFKLPGILGQWTGDLERNILAITLEGDQGGGKTQLLFQLVDSFADIGMTSGIFSLEMGKLSSTLKRFRDENIKPVNNSYIEIADQVPDGIETIKCFARRFDVVVIDSWTKLNIGSEEFDKLRREFPNTIWIVVFQRTSGGKIRGGTRPLFDAGMNIEVIKVDDTFVNNYAVITKNRYGDTGIKYNIKKKEIIKSAG